MTRALITGVAGQDGSYLAELLLAEGYEVHGTARSTELRTGSVDPAVNLHSVDFARDAGIGAMIARIAPDHVYNLAAVSSVYRSWQDPLETAKVNGLAVAELLAAVCEQSAASGRSIRFVQASSAEIFGMAPTSPQTEETPVAPVSPYGAAKAYAHHLVGAYRTAGVFATACIMYGHESPRRPEAFVTRKITAAAARISLGLQESLELGNLHVRRDWGWAPDYVDALHRAATAPVADDYIIATGVLNSVGDFAQAAFARVGIENWRDYVTVSAELSRSADPTEQAGNAGKAKRILDWRPTRNFDDIVQAMVDEDLRLARLTLTT